MATRKASGGAKKKASKQPKTASQPTSRRARGKGEQLRTDPEALGLRSRPRDVEKATDDEAMSVREETRNARPPASSKPKRGSDTTSMQDA